MLFPCEDSFPLGMYPDLLVCPDGWILPFCPKTDSSFPEAQQLPEFEQQEADERATCRGNDDPIWLW